MSGRVKEKTCFRAVTGLLTDKNGAIITIAGLWALIAGSTGSAESDNASYSSAGPNGDGHGLSVRLAQHRNPQRSPPSWLAVKRRLAVQKKLCESAHQLPIIFIVGHGDIPVTVQAMRADAIASSPPQLETYSKRILAKMVLVCLAVLHKTIIYQYDKELFPDKVHEFSRKILASPA